MALLNRFLALLLGLSAGVLCLWLLIEAAAGAAGRETFALPAAEVDEDLRDVTWSDDVVEWVAISLLAGGGALMAIQLLPRRPASYACRGTRQDRFVMIGRRGLQAELQRLAAGQDGVVGASVKLRRRRARITIYLPTAERAKDPAAAAHVYDAAITQLADLDLAKPLRLSVHPRPARRRVE